MWPLSPMSNSNGSKASIGSRSNGRSGSSSKGSKQACLLLPAVAVLACVALTATTLALVSSTGPARLAGDDSGQGSRVLLLQGLRDGIRLQLQLSQLPTTASRRALNLPQPSSEAAAEAGESDTSDSTPPAPAPTQHQQHQQYGESRFEAHGAPAAHMYVHFAAHRISDTTFAVLGLTPGVMQNSSRPVILACHWDYPNPDGPPPPAAADSATAAAAGTTTTSNTSTVLVLLAAPVRRYRDVWFGETYGRTYSPLLVHCRFPAPGVDAARGGALHLTVATFSPLPGDTARVQALAAAPGAVPPPGAFRAPFPVAVAVCGPPMHGNLSARAVREWLAYHYALLNNGTDAGGGTDGGVHFYLYDAGGMAGSPAVQRAVAPFLESVTVVDLRAGAGYDAWYHHQVLGVNDCMARARARARWAVHLDLDEYLMPAPPRTMAQVLAEHEAVPWVTFPSLPHNTRLCATADDDDDGDVEDGADDADEQQATPGGRWLIERAALRKWRPECWHPPADGRFLCLGAHGRRKVAADPRRVVNAGIHRVLVPERGGVHLTHAVAAVHHYRGAAQRGGAPPCREGRFRLAAARAWAAAMDESRAAAAAPVHGGGGGGQGEEEEEEPPWWREDRPDVLDEGMLEQARVAKRYIRANLPAAAIPLPLEDLPRSPS